MLITTPQQITLTLQTPLYESFCAVASIRTWSRTSLPENLSEKKIEEVPNSCDRKSAVDMRDYPVLMLLSRLGLRASEIVLLKLYNDNWHSGSRNIRGKGRSLVSLPFLD